MSNSSEHSRRMEATAEDPTPPPAEGAGPLDHNNYESLENLLAGRRSPSPNPGSEENSEQNGEQALESHEVMELQAFSERKEWIIDKIKVRGSAAPPVSLFFPPDDNPRSFWRACLPSSSSLTLMPYVPRFRRCQGSLLGNNSNGGSLSTTRLRRKQRYSIPVNSKSSRNPPRVSPESCSSPFLFFLVEQPM
jgi:hypothetical protein